MDADWSVELGRDDDALELPWSSDEGDICFQDLKRHPQFLDRIVEAAEFPELRHFLCTLNSASSDLMTAKCDVWIESSPEIQSMYGVFCRFASYVDIVFSDDVSRFSFGRHERFAREVAGWLEEESAGLAAAEIIVRRCYYHESALSAEAQSSREVDSSREQLSEDSRSGFYVTFYAFGFGDDEKQARRRWAHSLSVAAPVILRSAQEPVGADPGADFDDNEG